MDDQWPLAGGKIYGLGLDSLRVLHTFFVHPILEQELIVEEEFSQPAVILYVAKSNDFVVYHV